MKNYTVIKSTILLCTIFLHYGCGKNVKYIEKTDISRQVNLKNFNCDRENFFFILEEISVLNTVQDTFVVRSHTPLGLDLRLKAVNKESQPKEIILNDDLENPNFIWVDGTSEKFDTIGFFNTKNKTRNIVGANDSLQINLQTRYFNFYKLFGNQTNYSKSMQDLLSKEFSLFYIHENKRICIEQNSATKIVIYNHKSRWDWW